MHFNSFVFLRAYTNSNLYLTYHYNNIYTMTQKKFKGPFDLSLNLLMFISPTANGIVTVKLNNYENEVLWCHVLTFRICIAKNKSNSHCCYLPQLNNYN